jgi:UDP-N-acetylmuramoylalanine--D-glutamate ligase
MKLIGEHNLVAANLAYEAALQCGVSNEDIEKAIALFPGVEGRLQDLGMVGKNQIRVLNDNNATTADATIAAIEAVIDTYRKKPIVILGGADKGLPLTKLEEMLLIMVKEVIFLEGTGTDKINLPKKYQYATLSECLTKAMSLAEGDDVVLFSPGFASFSKEFNNEYERNDAFLQLVKNIV